MPSGTSLFQLRLILVLKHLGVSNGKCTKVGIYIKASCFVSTKIYCHKLVTTVTVNINTLLNQS